VRGNPLIDPQVQADDERWAKGNAKPEEVVTKLRVDEILGKPEQRYLTQHEDEQNWSELTQSLPHDFEDYCKHQLV
jgi:hypothetical protein